MNEKPSSVAELLRLAKKRTLLSDASSPAVGTWSSVVSRIEKCKEGTDDWPSEDIAVCLFNGDTPFSAVSELLSMAIAREDLKLVNVIISCVAELDDVALVDALLLAQQTKNHPTTENKDQQSYSESILQAILKRTVNQSLVINRIRQLLSLEDTLCLMEAAVELICKQSPDDYSLFRSVTTWIQALLDSHFFGFAQRLGFSTSSVASVDGENGHCEPAALPDKIKVRLEAVIDQLLTLLNDQINETRHTGDMLSLIERSIALVNNRMPSASRYRDQNGKSHRDYAVRVISL